MVELPANKRRDDAPAAQGELPRPRRAGRAGRARGVPSRCRPGRRRTGLALARWLVDPKNPLTARVAVNRYWAQLFGVGLVETEEDFGTQGEPPSHPELLDWLAVRLPRIGLGHQGPAAADRHLGDVSAIVEGPAGAAGEGPAQPAAGAGAAVPAGGRDGPRPGAGPERALEPEGRRPERLPAAARRPLAGGVQRPAHLGDQHRATTAIAAGSTSSGGGRCPIPRWPPSTRPSREICAMRRVRTNTPLQAFVTLNDPVYVEAAQALARRIVREGGSTSTSRVRYALPLCLCRPPGPSRSSRWSRSTAAELDRYRKDRDAAVALATEPIGPLAGRDGPRRAGRLDGRRQRAAEPRQRLDARGDRHGIRGSRLPLTLQQARAQTRRQFLRHSQAGLGASRWRCSSSARAGRSPGGRAGPHVRRPTTRWRPGRRISRRRRSRHLSAHVGRPAAAGPVRLQARAGQAPHAALPRRAAQEPEVRVHQGASQAARLAVQVRAVRPERRRGSASCCRTCAGVVDDVAIIRSM